MEKEQIGLFAFERLQTAQQRLLEPLADTCEMPLPNHAFGGDPHIRRPGPAEHLPGHRLRFATSVKRREIDQRDAAVDGEPKRRNCLLPRGFAPDLAEPAAA